MLRLLRRLVILVLAAIALFVLDAVRGARSCRRRARTRRQAFAASSTSTRSGPTEPARSMTSPRPRHAPAWTSSSSPITATGRARRICPTTATACLYIDARRDQHERRSSRRARSAEGAVSARGDARDVVEDIRAARRVCDRGASRLGEAGAAMDRRGMPRRRTRVAERATASGVTSAGGRLRATLVAYPFRPPQALALLLDRPEPVIRSLGHAHSAASRRRRRRSRCALRAWVSARSASRTTAAASLHFPSYDALFREFSIALPERPIDRRRRRRRAERARGDPRRRMCIQPSTPWRDRRHSAFTATSGSGTASMGDTLPLGGPVTCESMRRRRLTRASRCFATVCRARPAGQRP